MRAPFFLWRFGLRKLVNVLIMFTLFFCVLYIYLESQLPDVDSLKQIKLQVPLKIYSHDGKLMGEFGEKRRIPVKYDEIPPLLVHAVLATEDQRFFEHPGVDFWGIGRAAVELVKTGRKSQGGSTITMQVARNFFLSRKKTFMRKFNEILLAIKIDSELPKEKILELYLNKIYLGNRAYGVAAAAKVYYGKNLNELTLAQIAMIAGLPQAPSSQNPIANPTLAKKRRDHVLERMQEEGFISEADMNQAIQTPLTAKYHGIHIALRAPYVTEMIRQNLYDQFGDQIYQQGFEVRTTIDSTLQETATNALENALIAYTKRHGYRGPLANLGLSDDGSRDERLVKALKRFPSVGRLVPAVILSVDEKKAQALTAKGEHINLPWIGMKWARKQLKHGYVGAWPKKPADIFTIGDAVYVEDQDYWQLSQLPKVEGAIVSMNPKDGSILALSGGFNFYQSKYNRITQASRQPGSSFKPFIYAAALAKGFTLASIINDAPVVVDDPSQANLWRPHNVTNQFYGPTRIREGLIRSRNLVSIRLLEAVGIPYTLDYLQRFGFHREELPNTLSLALGSLTLSPMELTKGYAVFANGGYLVEPHVIDSIKDGNGQIVLDTLPTIACGTTCDDVPADQQAKQVITPQVSYLINSALRDVIQNGTGRFAKVLKRNDIAGKTGTTNDQLDAWFAGFNQDIVTTTWVGFDNPKSLREYASRLALPIWIDYMRVALKDKKQHRLSIPPGMSTVRIDPKTGYRTQNLDVGIFEVFRNENIPNFQDETVSFPKKATVPNESLF